MGYFIRYGDKIYKKLEFPGESGVRPKSQGERAAYRLVLYTKF